MLIRNKIQISAAPEKIWGLVTDPLVMKTWNPRIVEAVPVTVGKPKANSQYRIRYNLGRRENNYLAEIMEYEEFSRLVLHLEGGNLPKKGYIQEIYELTLNNKGTLLTRTILIGQARTGLLSGLFLRLNNMIGRSSGKKNLNRLRALAESGV